MKTFFTNSIYTRLVLFMFILLTISCSKKDSVDARDQYIGTYNVTITGVAPNTRTLKTSIKFSKSPTTGQLVLTDNAGDNIVILSGSDFSLTMHSVNQNIFGDKDVMMRHGSGQFDGNTVKMTTYTGNSDNGDVRYDYIGTKQ